MTASWDVFISHSTQDVEIVTQVADDLEDVGLSVWLDRSTIGPGERIREKINLGIKNSTVVLIFISRRSLKSRWVLNELDAAMLREINERRPLLLPVLIGRVHTNELPEDLKGKKYLDLRYNFEKKYR
jgi:TIR domain